MKQLAPIVLFTYNRLEHTKKTIEALVRNTLSKESELFIFSDGGKDEASWKQVQVVREYLCSIKGFKKITLIEQEKNIGLADSIVNGVTQIVNEYGKIIVLEDDIVTSPSFLDYMNRALDFYENKTKVWHVSGWNYPIHPQGFDETFLWRGMNCWGWGTWRDRWQHYHRDAQKFIEQFSEADIRSFNMDGADNVWNQVLRNAEGLMNTWAVFWHATIFSHQGLCLNPTLSYVQNIGFDGSGSNTGMKSWMHDALNEKKEISFVEKLEENIIALERIKLFYYEDPQHARIEFSKKLNRFVAKLHALKNANQTYILYGAGVVAELVVGVIQESILFIVDTDIAKQGRVLYGKNVYAPQKLLDVEYKNVAIIVSVLGREELIEDFLTTKCAKDKKNIIRLDG